MMEMDKIVKNKLINLEIDVPDEVWYGIQRELDITHTKKSFLIYRYAAAIAAFAIIGSTIFYFFNKKDTSIKQSEMFVENTTANQTKEKDIINIQNKGDREEKIFTAQSENFTQKQEKDLSGITEILQNRPVVKEIKREEKVLLAANYEKLNPFVPELKRTGSDLEIILKENATAIPDLNYLPDVDLIYALNNDVKVAKDKNKWAVGGEFSPLYSYRHIASTQNGKDAAYYNELENPVLTYSGGVNVQYNALKRLTVQTGVYYTSIGQSIDYVGVYANNVYDMVPEEYRDRYINSYNIDNSVGNISFNTKYVFIDNKSARVNNLSDNKEFLDINNPVYNDLNASVEQNLKYLEIPVILRYKLIDKIIDVNIIGGLSANFLVENNVYLRYSGVKEDIGHTQGINNINYSGNIGFGVDYPLTKQLNFRLEPTFRYYLNPVSSNSDIDSHPYTMGLFTGICYSF